MRFTILPSPLLMGRRQDFSTREKEKIVRIHHEIREEHQILNMLVHGEHPPVRNF